MIESAPNAHPGDSFPAAPSTDDGKRTALLALLGVKGMPNVYVLGSYARYVTIYAQQVRALNLIAALAKNGVLSSNTRVGVVGGGIAGVTTAAAALKAGVARVELFEYQPSLMRLQRNTEKRFVHPHIYDWPEPDTFQERADLPVMSWRANSAAAVVEDLGTQLDELVASSGGRLQTRTGVKVKAIRHTGNEPVVVHGATQHEFDAGILDDESEFDVVILAVGFGKEGSNATYGYWTDDDIGAPELEARQLRWVVSGSGDGALTDLMRLCILDFRHQRVLEAVDKATREIVGQSLLLTEASAMSASDRRSAFMNAAILVDSSLLSALRFRETGQVYLNCSEDALFEAGSSVLNRFIGAWLLHNKRFQILPGRIRTGPTRINDRYQLIFEDGQTFDADRVIVRHGPVSVFSSEPGLQTIGSATSAVRAAWRTVRKLDDWTRTPMYNDEVAFEDLASVRRVKFSNKVGTVVVTGKNRFEGRPLRERIAEALERLAKRKGTERYAPGRVLDETPEHISIERALSSPAMYERAVRALCLADIAVFDVTGYESAVMVLLGIRSAVRRGVTVCVTGKVDPKPPFNLISLNPLLVDRNYVAAQVESFEAAFAALVSIPNRYLDLPVYDAVRALGDDSRIREPSQEILVLRWFDEQYGRLVGEEIIRNRLMTEWPGSLVVTTLDSRSPQLTEQRLYAAIRRDRLCLVDWTGRRPNVFFELGVRLAVSADDPVCILCNEMPNGWHARNGKWPTDSDPWFEPLARLFGVTTFTADKSDSVRDRLREDLNGRIVAHSLLSPGRTYKVITDAIDASREPGGESIEAWLERDAGVLAGPPLEEGGVPVLYAEALKEQVRVAAAERLVAAWFYLDGRYKIVARMQAGTLPATDPQLTRLSAVGARFISYAQQVESPELRRMKDEIALIIVHLRRYQKRGARVEVIADVRELKAMAMVIRDAGEFAEAVETLREAEKLLVNELKTVGSHREAGDRAGAYETQLSKQLYQILGSIGGVYRRAGKFAESARAFSEGYEVEKGFDDSYNLTQRLVSRVLINPDATMNDAVVEGESVRVELQRARAVIVSQTPREKDEYAVADLLTIAILLGDADWRAALARFVALAPAGAYSRNVTRDVFVDLATRLPPESSAAASIAARLRQAVDELR